MEKNNYSKAYLDENSPSFVVEYSDGFEEQIKNIDYAIANIITDSLAAVSVRLEDLKRLRKEVPAIRSIEARGIYVLQEIAPTSVDNINKVLINPYLNLKGSGVVVGLIDTGIDYLNEEFIREDGTSRILKIWDQSIENKESLSLGQVYDNNQINMALQAYRDGKDPYEIVPSKDEEYHGSQMASIIGARGYNEQIKGIANNCEFVVVKLLTSSNYKKIQIENNLKPVPVYNNSEVLAAVEFLRKTKEEIRKPMIIYLGVGSQDGAHDGNNLTARYISYIATRRGVIFVSGTGNSALDEGHVLGSIPTVNTTSTVELLVTKNMKSLNFSIWIKSPDRMALKVISPSGESVEFIDKSVEEEKKKKFIFTDTTVQVFGFNPETFTGHQVYIVDFNDIKSGIWKFELKGEYIVYGRFDIWLKDKSLLPEGTRFLQSNSDTTLTIPSTANNTITVATYNENIKSIAAFSGRGFNSNGLINPDIATSGVDILTISKNKGETTTVTGSSVATAIVAGALALLLEWGVVRGNDRTINSIKARAILAYAGKRQAYEEYPNKESGYGLLDIFECFKVLDGEYRSSNGYREYYINNLFIRMPKN